MQGGPTIRHSGEAIIGTQLRPPGRLARRTNVDTTRMPWQDQRMTTAAEGFSSPSTNEMVPPVLQQTGPATSVNDQAWLILARAGGLRPPLASMKRIMRSRASLFLRLVMQNGRSPRMRLASGSIF